MGANTRSPWTPTSAPPSLSIARVFGTLAIAIGVGVIGYHMLDGHTHTCESCGHRWRHLGAFNLGDPAAHTCGRCNTVQWWKDGTPHVFRDVLRQPPPKPLPEALVSMQINSAPRRALDAVTAMTWVPR